MALDRQHIEKKDFPIGRRGYEPEAVDAHLAAVAAEVAQLTATATAGGSSELGDLRGDRGEVRVHGLGLVPPTTDWKIFLLDVLSIKRHFRLRCPYRTYGVQTLVLALRNPTSYRRM